MTKTMLTTVLLFALGCGDSSSKPGHPTGPCADPSGAYLFHLSERGGTCGAVPDSIITIDSISSAMAGSCQSANESAADHCSATIHEICPQQDGGSIEAKGTLNSEDNASTKLNGVWTITVYAPGGAVSCVGTYDVSYTRQ